MTHVYNLWTFRTHQPFSPLKRTDTHFRRERWRKNSLLVRNMVTKQCNHLQVCDKANDII
uniref:Uncharacterized protein n=1 Tax=Arundo donax TaxID=35708 RepID=A0A0A8YSI1_ARUDO